MGDRADGLGARYLLTCVAPLVPANLSGIRRAGRALRHKCPIASRALLLRAACTPCCARLTLSHAREGRAPSSHTEQLSVRTGRAWRRRATQPQLTRCCDARTPLLQMAAHAGLLALLVLGVLTALPGAQAQISCNVAANWTETAPLIGFLGVGAACPGGCWTYPQSSQRRAVPALAGSRLGAARCAAHGREATPRAHQQLPRSSRELAGALGSALAQVGAREQAGGGSRLRSLPQRRARPQQLERRERRAPSGCHGRSCFACQLFPGARARAPSVPRSITAPSFPCKCLRAAAETTATVQSCGQCVCSAGILFQDSVNTTE